MEQKNNPIWKTLFPFFAQLGADNTKVQIPLKNVAVGLYYYKIKFGDKEVIGKLNINE